MKIKNCCKATKYWAYDGTALRVSIQCPHCGKHWTWTQRLGWINTRQSEYEPHSMLDALSCNLRVEVA